jgi:hypothetical protein
VINQLSRLKFLIKVDKHVFRLVNFIEVIDLFEFGNTGV